MPVASWRNSQRGILLKLLKNTLTPSAAFLLLMMVVGRDFGVKLRTHSRKPKLCLTQHELYHQNSLGFAVGFEVFSAQRSTPAFSASIADTIQHFPYQPHPVYPEIPPYYVAPLPIEYPEEPLFCVYGDAVMVIDLMMFGTLMVLHKIRVQCRHHLMTSL